MICFFPQVHNVHLSFCAWKRALGVIVVLLPSPLPFLSFLTDANISFSFLSFPFLLQQL